MFTLYGSKPSERFKGLLLFLLQSTGSIKPCPIKLGIVLTGYHCVCDCLCDHSVFHIADILRELFEVFFAHNVNITAVVINSSPSLFGCVARRLSGPRRRPKNRHQPVAIPTGPAIFPPIEKQDVPYIFPNAIPVIDLELQIGRAHV